MASIAHGDAAATDRPAARQVRWLNSSRLANAAALALLGGVAALMVVPFLWMFSTSLRPTAESFDLPPAWLPTEWRFENYSAVFES